MGLRNPKSQLRTKRSHRGTLCLREVEAIVNVSSQLALAPMPEVSELDKLDSKIWLDPTVYASMIVDKRIPAGESVIAVCEKVLVDHDRFGTTPNPDHPWFDAEYAQKVLNFFGYLHHVRGWLKGRRFVWQPWHKCILAEWFGWRELHQAHGLSVVVPRHKRLFLEVGRKGSKTTGVVGILLHKLFFAKDGAEIYGLATSHKQARYAFQIAQEQIGYLANYIKAARYMHYNMTTSRITNFQKQNFYEVLSPKSRRDKQTNDSYNPSIILFDEASQIQDRETFEDMTTGMGARPDGQQIYITTDSEDETTFYAEEKKLLKTKLQDRAFDDMEGDLPFFYHLDKEDLGKIDADESTWIKPMPHIGHSVPYKYIRKELKDSRELPSKRRVLMTKYFNLPMPPVDAWLPLEQLTKNHREEIRRTGPLVVGIDLGIKYDFSAVTRMWEPQRDFYQWDYRAFMPKSRMQSLPEGVKRFLEQAAELGYLELTDTQTIDIPRVVDYLEETEREFDPELYAFDNFHMLNVVDQAITRDVFKYSFDESQPESYLKTRSIGQTFRSLSAPTKKLEAAIVKERTHHVGSPFINWQFISILLEWSPTGDLCMLGKDRTKVGFIDNFSALTNCMAGNLLLHQSRPEHELTRKMDQSIPKLDPLEYEDTDPEDDKEQQNAA